MSTIDRRRFPRLNLEIYYRPAGIFGPRKAARDVSRGGIRVHTDDPLEVGTRLEVELFLPDGDSLTVDVRVAWIQELADEGAQFEAGLEFLEMEPHRAALLERYLETGHELP